MRSIFLFFLILGIGVVAYPDTVFHLKTSVESDRPAIPVSGVIVEKVDGFETDTLRLNGYYSNEQIAALLRAGGCRDFILIGEGVKITPPVPKRDVEVVPAVPSPKNIHDFPEPEFYIRNVLRNTGEVIFRKGAIAIAVPVLIRSKTPDGVFLVQNMSGGRFYRVSVRNPAEDTRERRQEYE